jgi:hypothetical protein
LRCDLDWRKSELPQERDSDDIEHIQCINL